MTPTPPQLLMDFLTSLTAEWPNGVSNPIPGLTPGTAPLAGGSYFPNTNVYLFGKKIYPQFWIMISADEICMQDVPRLKCRPEMFVILHSEYCISDFRKQTLTMVVLISHSIRGLKRLHPAKKSETSILRSVATYDI